MALASLTLFSAMSCTFPAEDEQVLAEFDKIPGGPIRNRGGGGPDVVISNSSSGFGRVEWVKRFFDVCVPGGLELDHEAAARDAEAAWIVALNRIAEKEEDGGWKVLGRDVLVYLDGRTQTVIGNPGSESCFDASVAFMS